MYLGTVGHQSADTPVWAIKAVTCPVNITLVAQFSSALRFLPAQSKQLSLNNSFSNFELQISMDAHNLIWMTLSKVCFFFVCFTFCSYG